MFLVWIKVSVWLLLLIQIASKRLYNFSTFKDVELIGKSVNNIGL